MKIAVVKYNAGNIYSVDYALKRLGVEATITSDKEVLMSADKVIFPGVGEAETTMSHLRKNRLDEVIKNLKIEKTVLFVTKGKDELVMRAVSNIAKADVTTANLLNVYDIVASSKVVLTSDAAKYIEEAYKA